MRPRTHWTALSKKQQDGTEPSTLYAFIEDFKNNFGAQINMDLSEESELTKHLVTLTQSDAVDIFEGLHPHFKAEDVPDFQDVPYEEGKASVAFSTRRLQSALENYAIERITEFFDKRKTSVVCDPHTKSNQEDKVFEAVHNYFNGHVLKDFKGQKDSDTIKMMLENAWSETVEFYRPRRVTHETSPKHAL